VATSSFAVSARMCYNVIACTLNSCGHRHRLPSSGQRSAFRRASSPLAQASPLNNNSRCFRTRLASLAHAATLPLAHRLPLLTLYAPSPCRYCRAMPSCALTRNNIVGALCRSPLFRSSRTATSTWRLTLCCRSRISHIDNQTLLFFCACWLLCA